MGHRGPVLPRVIQFREFGAKLFIWSICEHFETCYVLIQVENGIVDLPWDVKSHNEIREYHLRCSNEVWTCMKPRVQLYRNFHWWSTKWVLCQNEASKLLSRFLPSNNLTNSSCNSRKIPFEEQNPSFTWQTLFHSKSKISDFIGKLFWKVHYWATFTFFLFCTLFETTRDHKIELLAIFRG